MITALEMLRRRLHLLPPAPGSGHRRAVLTPTARPGRPQDMPYVMPPSPPYELMAPVSILLSVHEGQDVKRTKWSVCTGVPGKAVRSHMARCECFGLFIVSPCLLLTLDGSEHGLELFHLYTILHWKSLVRT